MGAVSYGQGGYVGTSMSVRAQEAYESGEMPMSKWTRGAIISAIKDYCADFDLAYFPEMTPDQIAERDDEAREERASASERNSFMKARENAFAERFGCNASSVLAYEAFHPERCTRFLSKRSKREIIGYDLPDKAADWGMKPEQTCPVELAARSHVVCFNAFRDGIGGDTDWHDLDFDRVAELFDERGLDGLLEAKRDEAELSGELDPVRDEGCR